MLGTELAGGIARIGSPAGPAGFGRHAARLHFNGGSVGGQGLGAFNVYGVDIRVEGGAQDGVAKTMLGGKVAVLKGKNRFGGRVNGSVGKSFAYGAQRGRLFVQGIGRLALLHPPVRRRRGDRRRARSSRSTTSWAAWPTGPTSRASPSST